MRRLFLLALIPLALGCQAPDHKGNIAIVREYVNSVESLEYATMDELLAEDYMGLGPSAGDTINKADALESWKYNIETLYESIEYTRSQYAGITISEGPNRGKWVSNWAELMITYQDDGGTATIWANSIYKVEQGKIVKSYTFYNEADVLRQLGYVFVNPEEL